MRLPPLILLGLLVAVCLLPMSAQAGGNSPVRLYIEGGGALAVNGSADYKVIVVGAEGTEWMYKAYLTGANLTGASPTVSAPANGNVTSTSFQVNVTAPTIKGGVELYVKVYRTVGEKEEWRDATKHIEVVEPIRISCVVENTSGIDLVGLEVEIYVDGVMIDRQQVTITSGESTVVRAEWVTASPAPGEHLLEVKGDVDGDGRISAAKGDIYASKRFYIRSEGLDISYIVIAGVVAVLVGMVLIKRRKIR